MKSAYELAMERLNKASPTVKLTDKQKKQIAELDSLYKSKIAQLEITLQGEINAATESGNAEELQKLEERLQHERKKLQADLEDKKDRVRQPRG